MELRKLVAAFLVVLAAGFAIGRATAGSPTPTAAAPAPVVSPTPVPFCNLLWLSDDSKEQTCYVIVWSSPLPSPGGEGSPRT